MRSVFIFQNIAQNTTEYFNIWKIVENILCPWGVGDSILVDVRLCPSPPHKICFEYPVHGQGGWNRGMLR